MGITENTNFGLSSSGTGVFVRPRGDGGCSFGQRVGIGVEEDQRLERTGLERRFSHVGSGADSLYLPLSERIGHCVVHEEGMDGQR